MSSLLMFAAKGNPEVEAIGSLILLIVCVVTLICYGVHAATHEFSVVTKRGVPYCRNCGRQVSWRRDQCRACGTSLYVARPLGGPDSDPSDRELRRKHRQDAQKILAHTWRERWASLAEFYRLIKEQWSGVVASRRASRRATYRAAGIEPGPWAWFQALPDATQAILLSLAFAVPAGASAFAFFAGRSPGRPEAPARAPERPAAPVVEPPATPPTL